MCHLCSLSDDEEGEGGAAANPKSPGQHTGGRRVGRNYAGPFRKTPGRLVGMIFIRLYQLTLSGFIGNSCRHLPTCSEYGYEAIARYGIWAGGWMTLFRVGRCGPGGTSGFDPVPDALGARFRWFTPWRYFRLKSQSD